MIIATEIHPSPPTPTHTHHFSLETAYSAVVCVPGRYLCTQKAAYGEHLRLSAWEQRPIDKAHVGYPEALEHHPSWRMIGGGYASSSP